MTNFLGNGSKRKILLDKIASVCFYYVIFAKNVKILIYYRISSVSVYILCSNLQYIFFFQYVM